MVLLPPIGFRGCLYQFVVVVEDLVSAIAVDFHVPLVAVKGYKGTVGMLGVREALVVDLFAALELPANAMGIGRFLIVVVSVSTGR